LAEGGQTCKNESRRETKLHRGAFMDAPRPR
jgi:hypothetical protein